MLPTEYIQKLDNQIFNIIQNIQMDYEDGILEQDLNHENSIIHYFSKLENTDDFSCVNFLIENGQYFGTLFNEFDLLNIGSYSFILKHPTDEDKIIKVFMSKKYDNNFKYIEAIFNKKFNDVNWTPLIFSVNFSKLNENIVFVEMERLENIIYSKNKTNVSFDEYYSLSNFNLNPDIYLKTNSNIINKIMNIMNLKSIDDLDLSINNVMLRMKKNNNYDFVYTDVLF